MLLLLFYVGKERYSLESQRVVEVLPLMTLEKRRQYPDTIAGLFNYRGAIVPVIDLCHLLRGTACRFQLSSRIILVNAAANPQPPAWVGLLAERVLETIHKSDTKGSDVTNSLESLPYLGQMLVDEQGTIQCIQVDSLLQTLQPSRLLLAEQPH